MKKDNIPEIRMPGFKEEWKHKKFHAVFDYLQIWRIYRCI